MSEDDSGECSLLVRPYGHASSSRQTPREILGHDLGPIGAVRRVVVFEVVVVALSLEAL